MIKMNYMIPNFSFQSHRTRGAHDCTQEVSEISKYSKKLKERMKILVNPKEPLKTDENT